MSADVLEQAPLGLKVCDALLDDRPQVARVVGSESLSGVAERLAGISANESRNLATPCSEIEGSQVAPERSRMNPPRLHVVDQERGCRGFVFHETDCASLSACCDVNSEVEAVPSCADADVVAGTQSHIHSPVVRLYAA